MKKPKKNKAPRVTPPKPAPLPRPVSKPEILAPAGSPVTWAAAVEAGADAVYMGLKKFSARAFAANFSFEDLAGIVDLTHENGAKIYIAFNSLLKEGELEEAIKALDVLSNIKPDALIVQDLGLLRLIKTHYPHFEVHASTLMAVHNHPGLTVLKDLGFDRAVLARELTLKEIERLTATRPLNVEVFIHGALCFSFSGLCLMSSFLGGKGSLRGACTQPCRRAYTSGKKKGYFFSPSDLDATEALRYLRTLPISAFKIEGRMKGAEYVTNVVKAYRSILDASDSDLDQAIVEAGHLLDQTPGRHRSSGFFFSPQAEETLSPHLAATSGLYLGKITKSREGCFTLPLQNGLESGDRLRVQFAENDDRQALTVQTMKREGHPVTRAESGEVVEIEAPFPAGPGDLVFKVDVAKGQREAAGSRLLKDLGARSARLSLRSKSAAFLKARAAVSPPPKGRPASGRKPDIWFRVARTEEIVSLIPLKPDRIIVPITPYNVKRLANVRRKIGDVFTKIVWSLPALVMDGQLHIIKRDLGALARMGVQSFMVSNLSHFPLVSGFFKGRRGRSVVYADYRLNCLNSQSELELARLGLKGLTLCLETDEENLTAMLAYPAPVERLLYIFGRPPLFTSRLLPAGLKDNLPITSPKGERFRLRNDQGFLNVFSEKPIFMSPLLKQRQLPGVTAFIVDLENDPRPMATARDLLEAINRGRPIKSASRFNLNRGLF